MKISPSHLRQRRGGYRVRRRSRPKLCHGRVSTLGAGLVEQSFQPDVPHLMLLYSEVFHWTRASSRTSPRSIRIGKSVRNTSSQSDRKWPLTLLPKYLSSRSRGFQAQFLALDEGQAWLPQHNSPSENVQHQNRTKWDSLVLRVSRVLLTRK